MWLTLPGLLSEQALGVAVTELALIAAVAELVIDVLYDER